MVGRRGGSGRGQDSWSPADDLFDGDGRYDYDGRSGHGFFARLFGGLLKLVLVAVLFVAGYITAPAWMPLVERHAAPLINPIIETTADPGAASTPGTSEEKVAPLPAGTSAGSSNLGSDGAKMSSRIAALEQSISSLIENTPDIEAIAALTRRVEAIEKALDAAEVDTASAASQGTPVAAPDSDTGSEALSAMDARLSAIETRLSQSGSSVGAGSLRLIAVGQLTSAADGERPFSAEVSALKSILGEDKDALGILERLSGPASAGAPTLDTLRRRLPDVAAEALVADARPDAEAGLLDRAVARMQSVVTVRRIDPDGSGSLDDLLATATQAMDLDNLGDAVDALSAIDGKAAGKVSGWLAGAQRRITIDEAVGELRAMALARPNGTE